MGSRPAQKGEGGAVGGAGCRKEGGGIPGEPPWEELEKALEAELGKRVAEDSWEEPGRSTWGGRGCLASGKVAGPWEYGVWPG